MFRGRVPEEVSVQGCGLQKIGVLTKHKNIGQDLQHFHGSHELYLLDDLGTSSMRALYSASNARAAAILTCNPSLKHDEDKGFYSFGAQTYMAKLSLKHSKYLGMRICGELA